MTYLYAFAIIAGAVLAVVVLVATPLAFGQFLGWLLGL